MAPQVFVASSTESLRFAEAIQQNLEPDLEVTVWKQGIFSANRATIDSLLSELGKFDLAIFIFSADDVTLMRDQTKQTSRDNVVFELGMFIARIGKDRTFVLTPHGVPDFHLPTDLVGIRPLTFYPNRDNPHSAVGAACTEVRRAAKALLLHVPRLSKHVGVHTRSHYAVLSHCAEATKFEEFDV